jgi:hypothetical protein
MKYYITHVWIFFQLQIDSQFLQPMRSECIPSSVCDSVCLWGLREGYGVKECLWEWTVMFLSGCIEGILQLFTNFYLQRKFLIFLRKDPDCKVVDPYNTRKRYAVTKSLDLMRNIPWLSSCFCKIKKLNKNLS